MEMIDDYYYFDPDLVEARSAVMLEVGTFTMARGAWWHARYPAGRVIFMEPEPDNYLALCSEIVRSPFRGFLAAQIALAVKTKPVILHRYPNKHSHSLFARHEGEGLRLTDTVTVEGVTLADALDRWSIPRLDLLLLNGEGCEIYAVYQLTRPTDEGAALRARVPQVCTAAHPQIYGAEVMENMREHWRRYYDEDRRPGPIPYFLYRRKDLP